MTKISILDFLGAKYRFAEFGSLYQKKVQNPEKEVQDYLN